MKRLLIAVEQIMKVRIRSLIPATLAVALAIGLEGIAIGGIPSADGVINACYNATSASPSGGLRVIDAEAGAKCRQEREGAQLQSAGGKG